MLGPVLSTLRHVSESLQQAHEAGMSYPPFIAEDTEAQRDEGTYLTSHSFIEARPELESRPLQPQGLSS